MSDMLLGGMTPLRPGLVLPPMAVPYGIGGRYGHGLGLTAAEEAEAAARRAREEADPITRFEQDLAGARQQWDARIRSTMEPFVPYFGMAQASAQVIDAIGSVRTKEDVFRLWGQLTSLASMAGPIGKYIGWIMDAIRTVASALLAIGEARAIQWQDGDQWALERHIAGEVLGIPNTDERPSPLVMRALGWIPFTFIPSGAFCVNSGGGPTDWIKRPHEPCRTIEDNLENWAVFAGPRATTPPNCTKYNAMDQTSWSLTSEGVASKSKALDLAEVLVGRGWNPKQTLQGGSSWAFRSDGLVFVNNTRIDLQPGALEYNVWVHTVLVKATMLPDELLVPIATYLHLMNEAMQASGSSRVLTPERQRITEAAFGPSRPLVSKAGSGDPEAKKRWNILRYLPLFGMDAALPAISDELVRRHGRGEAAPDGAAPPDGGPPKEDTSGKWSTGEKATAGVVGLGLVAGLTKLLGWW